MGERGPLRLPALALVAPPDTVAEEVQPIAPIKPDAVARNRELSKLWDELVPQLDKDGLLARSDTMALELALRHFLLARKASNATNRNLAVDDRTGSVKKNPAEAIFRAESAMFLRYAQQLGMTFAGRARTPTGKPAGEGGDDGEANPFASPAAQ
jgi:P27 family predicted phage terminase small subunit